MTTSTSYLEPIVLGDAGATDRLGLTLCLAALVHVMIVLGVGFAPEEKSNPPRETMEIVLVTRHRDKQPEETRVLAQADLLGGGEIAEDARPAVPFEPPLPAPVPQIAVATPPARAPAPLPSREPETPELKTAAAPADEAPREHPATPARLTRDVLEADLASAAPESSEPAENKAEKRTQEVRETQPDPLVESKPSPTAEQLIARSFALASLNAELQQRLEERADRPRRKFISASTQEYRFASYMEAWRTKVERIGNINYPDEARREKLSGSLLLDVALLPDGSVDEITVRRSSGHTVLDAAAVRIVELAAPYAPFPEDIRRDIDVLHITRTWKFLNTEEFRAR